MRSGTSSELLFSRTAYDLVVTRNGTSGCCVLPDFNWCYAEAAKIPCINHLQRRFVSTNNAKRSDTEVRLIEKALRGAAERLPPVERVTLALHQSRIYLHDVCLLWASHDIFCDRPQRRDVICRLLNFAFFAINFFSSIATKAYRYSKLHNGFSHSRRCARFPSFFFWPNAYRPYPKKSNFC